MEISRNGTKIDIMGYGNYGPLVGPTTAPIFNAAGP